MDYSLAALKLLCVHLQSARQAPSRFAMTLGPILFQRAWLQGVLVSTPSAAADSRLILDDGTGVIELSLLGGFRNRDWNVGMYVMVVGEYNPPTDELPIIKVHKIVDLTPFPDREAMWYLEVVEAFRLFYQPVFDEE